MDQQAINEQLMLKIADLEERLLELAKLFDDHVHMYTSAGNYSHMTGKPKSYADGWQRDDNNSDW